MDAVNDTFETKRRDFTPTYHAKRHLAVFLAVSSLVLFPTIISAQVEKPSYLLKGNTQLRTGANYRGTMPITTHIFFMQGAQTLSFKLTTTDPNAYVAVYETQQEPRLDEDLISEGEEEYPRIWSGKLPVTSEYSVQI